MMSKNSIVPFLKDYLIKFLTRPFLLDTNDFNNIIILCPNHHRIIHAYNPIFRLKTKDFLYPNGYKEGLQLNLHL